METLRTKIINECMMIKSYLSGWGLYYRLKFNVEGKEVMYKDILFPLLNDEDLYEIYSTTKRIASQPMA